ncbi:amidohydrolase family protein [Sulfuracidifex tepidarius]|uniref:5'-deoxyadenosine deaminase n=1 Tax=Sulfuracidifex tepidarius TaxID=1294262 RepID=A0A510E5N5_9CREN|nr:amidohydrolase family protein [Sulfuracidifex tepidarius]BBG27786.1 5'-deoxyadenosine deaminase [Sulfuracidifex tepidarius]
MLIDNVTFGNDSKRHSIYINGEGKVECIDCKKKDGKVIDAKGRLLVPPFVNSHSHLGYAMTLGYGRRNETGTLLDAVQILREDVLPKITEDDLKKRLDIALREMFLNGILYVRTHDPLINDIALKMLKVRENPLVQVQVVAFPTPSMFFEDNEEKLEKTITQGAEVVGMLPHHEDTYEEGVKSIKIAMDLAETYNKLVDGHVDEIDDCKSRYSEVVAHEAKVRKMGSKTTISHMTASHSYPGAYHHKLSLLLRDSGVNVVSNPIVNMYLQGRYDNYPKRRGVARIRELLRRGVNVALGTDNVMDSVFPLGDFNMLRVAYEAFLADHFVEGEYNVLLDMLTFNGARALSITDYGYPREGDTAKFVILNSRSFYDSLRTTVPPFIVMNGRYYGVNDIRIEVNGEDETTKVNTLD